MKPIVAYYGGKQRMANKIVQLLPRHTVYVEPFAGGASVFFAKPWPRGNNVSNYTEVLNDINGDLVNLYRVFQDREKAERLIHRLQFTMYSRQEYLAAREKTPPVDEVDRAWRTYVNLQMSFSKILNAGWATGVYGGNHAATWAKKVARLDEYLERMCGVYIECEDALDVIRRWDSPQTCFYCDPPYPGTDQGHYRGYTAEDFGRLVETLDACVGSFVLSNYDQIVPTEWERYEFDAYCSASRKGKAGTGRDKSRAANVAEVGDRKRVEVVWRRLNKVAVRKEIAELFAKQDLEDKCLRLQY